MIIPKDNPKKRKSMENNKLDDIYHDNLVSNKDYYQQFTGNYHPMNNKPEKKNIIDNFDSNTMIYKLSYDLSRQVQIPVDTCMIAILSTYSSFLCRKFNVARSNGSTMPTSIYAGLEHPVGSAKTRTINQAIEGFIDIHNSKTNELDETRIPAYLTNTTPEALDNMLLATGGYYSCISSEQTVLDRLFGLNKKDSINDNETVLNGFSGDYSSSSRITRKSYSGHVRGNVVCFAQYGTIDKILSASNGTGIAERFIFLSQESMVGSRDYLNVYDGDVSLWSFYYGRSCSFYHYVMDSLGGMNTIVKLVCEKEAYQLINEFRQELEPLLSDGKKYSSDVMRGFIGKIDMHILKIAANAYKMDAIDLSDVVIPGHYIKASIGVCRALIENLYGMLDKKEYAGIETEMQLIIDIFMKSRFNGKPMLLSLIHTEAIKLALFKRIGHDNKERKSYVTNLLDKMCIMGKLTKTIKSRPNGADFFEYRLAE